MVTLSFLYSDKHTVSFLGFRDEEGQNRIPKDISLMYPGIGITDIENIGKKKLKEFVDDGFYHDKPDQFFIDFDGNL